MTQSNTVTVIVPTYNRARFVGAAIESVLSQGREVVVTGCLGADKAGLLDRFPDLKFISGPQDVAPVISAVNQFIPGTATSFLPAGQDRLAADARMRLTPPHYSYLKISEGCNHSCSFCIIPDMRGGLRSRNLLDIVEEAQVTVAQGCKELLVIAQDLSAYGVDQKYPMVEVGGNKVRSDLEHLCIALGDIAPWVRLHYVYPYPHVDRVIPLMADGKILPYLDMPLQHASPGILKSMRRPAAAEKALQRIHRWREQCPELSIRSTFIVGFPGETEEDFQILLDYPPNQKPLETEQARINFDAERAMRLVFAAALVPAPPSRPAAKGTEASGPG